MPTWRYQRLHGTNVRTSSGGETVYPLMPRPGIHQNLTIKLSKGREVAQPNEPKAQSAKTTSGKEINNAVNRRSGMTKLPLELPQAAICGSLLMISWFDSPVFVRK